VKFCKGVVIKGNVTIKNESKDCRYVPPGTYDSLLLDLTVVECRPSTSVFESTPASSVADVGYTQAICPLDHTGVTPKSTFESSPSRHTADVVAGETPGASKTNAVQDNTPITPRRTIADHSHVSTGLNELKLAAARIRSLMIDTDEFTYESVPEACSADASPTKKVLIERSEPTIYETDPQETSATARAEDALGRPVAIDRTAPEVFERKPCQSVADACHSDSAQVSREGSSNGVFENQPSRTMAMVRHADAVQVARQEASSYVFESQPCETVASVKHGVAGEKCGSPSIFESDPTTSNAHAKAGLVNDAASESEYETDEEDN